MFHKEGCFKNVLPQRNTKNFSKEHKNANLIFNYFALLCEVLCVTWWYIKRLRRQPLIEYVRKGYWAKVNRSAIPPLVLEVLY